MKPRHARLMLIGLLLIGCTIAAILVLRSLEENLMYYYDPSQVTNGEVKQGQAFRIGGLVVHGSREAGEGATTIFKVTDNAACVTVRYDKLLPDLFAEGEAMIAKGQLDANNVFVADEVLAKHDENYMPAEVAKSLAGKKFVSCP